jgi:hypothetical protein
MAALGPIVVVAEKPAPDVVDALGKAGAFPIVETSWSEAPTALSEIKPAAMLVADPKPPLDADLVQALIKKLSARSGAYMPILMRVTPETAIAIPTALPTLVDEPIDKLTARLRSALRVRTLHQTVLRRAGTPARAAKVRAYPLPDLLDQATVLCLGRGRSYPALTTAIGERVGLIGALSVETAARYLNSRDIDGIVIGDGFGPKVVSALLIVLAEDARFRDLPIGVLGHIPFDDARLPNLVRLGDAAQLVEHILPLVRLQTFESQLKRTLKSLESEGTVDPATGLLACEAFWRDLERAVQEADDGGGCLSIARFSFEELADPRATVDAARLFSRLVRDIDFACQENDGSIIAAFTETDLRSAHVVARRIASVLRHTMLAPDPDRDTIKPTVTLATLKPSDNVSTLVARVGTYPKAG